MAPNNINFKLLSLNARGIRSFEKQKALFGWLMKDKSDICFLRESYSTPEVEKIWKSQWKGEMFFSHGTEHSKGVLILIRKSLEFEFKTIKVDQNGHFIILEANVQDHPFLFVNLYAPNKTNEQSTFFEEIREELDFWLVSNGMQEDIDNVDVIPSLKSDHLAIVIYEWN